METFTTVDYHLHHQYLYEVDELESLTFLFNLLYDDESALSHADILDILNGFKVREEKLPWSIESEPIDSDSGGSHVGGGDVRDSNNSDQFDFYQSSTGDSLGLISSWEFNGAMDFVGSLRLNGADIGFVGALGYIGSLGNTLGLTGFSQGFTGSRRDSSRGSSSLDLNGSGLYSTGSRQSSTPRQSSTSRQSSNVNQNSTNMITDTQGIKWRPHLLSKFKLERSRVGKNSWYHDFEGSREKSLKVCIF